MQAHTDIRPAAVAGSFYPADPLTLRHELRRCLAGNVPNLSTNERLKALIVPHAGYVYSGSVAGAAFAQLAPLAGQIRRVVLLGPCHRVALHGIAIPHSASFATPLGIVPLDWQGIDALADLPFVGVSDAAHSQEHALEVQLPFLQSVLGEFSLLPLVVGQASVSEVVTVLERLWGGDETLIVISSDLSHFHTYAEARKIDNASVAQILASSPLASHEQACGATPINGLLAVAQQRGLRIAKLAQCNSGDTAGDRSRVVGYASFALFQPKSDLQAVHGENTALGTSLLELARGAIASQFSDASANTAAPDLPTLAKPGACFVTLKLDGLLRGCIGTLEPHRSLLEDVKENAIAAALRDPRFLPLGAEELNRIKIEVSLLSTPQPLKFTDQTDALRQLRPHVDGVILMSSGHRSTFLPQVWEQLADPAEFMDHLKLKAGLAREAWPPDLQLYRYEVQKWTE
ncbi:MAG: AmmeMemoRadiSam system protein B [Pseudomonadota bacterium]